MCGYFIFSRMGCVFLCERLLSHIVTLRMNCVLCHIKYELCVSAGSAVNVSHYIFDEGLKYGQKGKKI